MDRASPIFAHWRNLGLSARAANTLCSLACNTTDDLRALGSEALRQHHGLGPPTYNEIASLVGWELMVVPPKRRRKPIAVTEELVQRVLTTPD